ncbi:hypothetical protein [Helicobacter mustelae]|uniref:hypothetical protein n=1 Tax=Helicobacter mustelae TaxID=217 RepID=UPI00031F5240|nr:hypothetical protein [Helicobacter mustelae]
MEILWKKVFCKERGFSLNAREGNARARRNRDISTPARVVRRVDVCRISSGLSRDS